MPRKISADELLRAIENLRKDARFSHLVKLPINFSNRLLIQQITDTKISRKKLKSIGKRFKRIWESSNLSENLYSVKTADKTECQLLNENFENTVITEIISDLNNSSKFIEKNLKLTDESVSFDDIFEVENNKTRNNLQDLNPEAHGTKKLSPSKLNIEDCGDIKHLNTVNDSKVASVFDVNTEWFQSTIVNDEIEISVKQRDDNDFGE